MIFHLSHLGKILGRILARSNCAEPMCAYMRWDKKLIEFTKACVVLRSGRNARSQESSLFANGVEDPSECAPDYFDLLKASQESIIAMMFGVFGRLFPDGRTRWLTMACVLQYIGQKMLIQWCDWRQQHCSSWIHDTELVSSIEDRGSAPVGMWCALVATYALASSSNQQLQSTSAQWPSANEFELCARIGYLAITRRAGPCMRLPSADRCAPIHSSSSNDSQS